MRSFSIFVFFLICASMNVVQANEASAIEVLVDLKNDSIRAVELDHFWNALAETVKTGDLEGYSSAYHEDAVVVFAGKRSVPIKAALESWEQGFIDTKNGEVKSDVEFRFSERIGDETTAFETGMFRFSVVDKDGNTQDFYADLQALLIKENGSWTCIMEYQKPSTEEKWNSIN